MATACFIPRARLLLAIAVCVAIVCAKGRAFAQAVVAPEGVAPAPSVQTPPATNPAMADFMGEPAGYRELIAEALIEYEAKHFEEARALFQRAHALFPNARTMRGQGMAEFELRNYGNAVQCFESALASPQRQLDGALRAETQQLLERAKRFVARVKLELRPGTATVLVDGTLLHASSGSVLLLSVGNHTLEIRAEAHQPVQRVVTVQGGEEQVLEVVLVPEGGIVRVENAKPTGGPRRFAVGPQVSSVLPVRGYADRTPGVGFDISFWSEFYLWALDARVGVRFDVAKEFDDYFHLPVELAGYRLVPFSQHAFLFGAGTGIAYLNERLENTSTVGNFAVTRTHTVLKDKTVGVPLLARVGMIFFRSTVASLMTTVDYSVTFADFKERSNEQAVRLQLGAIFGRSRP